MPDRKTVRLKLTKTLPIDEAYGMVEGKVIEAEVNREATGRGAVRWWHHHRDAKIGILDHEAEVLQGE